MSRTLTCDRPAYEHVTVSLPNEWLGKHARVRDEAMQQAVKANPDSAFFVNVCVALALVEKISGVEALQGEPKDWKIDEVPLPVLSWIEEAVIDDFLACFGSKPASSDLLTKALQEVATQATRSGKPRKKK